MEMYYLIAGVVVLLLIIAGVYAFKKTRTSANKTVSTPEQSGDTNTKKATVSPYLAAKVEKNGEISRQTQLQDLSHPEDREALALKSSELAKSETEQVDKKEDAAQADKAENLEAITAQVDPQTEIEIPEDLTGRMTRLRGRLSRSGSFGKMLLNVIGRGDLSIEDWEELEDTLIMADLGIEASEELITYLKTQAKVLNTNDPVEIKAVLRSKLLEMVDPSMDRSLNLLTADSGSQEEAATDSQKLPAVILAVGVNGVGKTTTVGKIARILVAENKRVLLGAADTFRAAAAEQLQTWGDRVGVEVVKSAQEGGDPASVAFETVKTAIEKQIDVALIDTAGRLQNKTALMDELGKVIRVIEKQAPLSETLLVLDATTGQNGMQQARVFAEVAKVSGIVLTKLDGTAKGGIVVNVQRELGVPVKLVGLGEGVDDLAPFDPENFVDALLTA